MGEERRRSPRLAIRILLRVEWVAGEKVVTHQAVSESISAHGVLLKLTADNPPFGRLMLENPATMERRYGRVVKVGAVAEGSKTFIVGIEFEEPTPEFWGKVYFYSAQGIEILHVQNDLLAARPEGAVTPKPLPGCES
jgi:hypothetical protein